MRATGLIVAILVFVGLSRALGQTPVAEPGRSSPSEWRGVSAGDQSPQTGANGTAPSSAASASPDAPANGQTTGARTQAAASTDRGPRTPVAKVTSGSGQLPNDQGQLWREYDITPYTLRVASTARPEQAVIDWILRETGYEVWHSEPLAVLSANRQVLRVYHTSEMQQIVADIVDRFVSTEADTHAFGVRVVSLSHPNWRGRAQRLLQPVPVQTPGTQAWLLHKEDAAVLLAELQRRSDYREHSSPHLLINNGQSAVVSATRGRNYVRAASFRTDGSPGFQPEAGLVDEGFSLEFSPLLSVDGRIIDAAIKCEIDQVEKMVSVPLEVPAAVAPRQRTKVEVPQMAHFRFHERFRWPVDQVLLVGFGMVALPMPSEGQSLVPGLTLPLPLPSSPPRADVLVFVESRGQTGQAARMTQGGRPDAKTYRGRY